MIPRPNLFLTGTVALQAFCLMLVGYTIRCGMIEWRLFGDLLLAALGMGAIFVPILGWVYKKTSHGRKMPWSAVLVFVLVLFSVPLGTYFWPYTRSKGEDLQRFLLGVCLYFLMAAPIFTSGMRGGERHEPK